MSAIGRRTKDDSGTYASNKNIARIATSGTESKENLPLAEQRSGSARQQERPQTKLNRIDSVLIAEGKSTVEICFCYCKQIAIGSAEISHALIQVRQDVKVKKSAYSAALFWVYLYLLKIPVEFINYLYIVYSLEIFSLICILDVFDIGTDVLLLLRFRNEGIEIVGWLVVAIIFGVWNLVYEVVMVSRGRRYTAKHQQVCVHDKLVSKRFKHGGLIEELRGSALFLHSVGLISRNLSEDTLIMIVALLRGQRIVGIQEQISFATTLFFVGYAIAHLWQGIAVVIGWLVDHIGRKVDDGEKTNEGVSYMIVALSVSSLTFGSTVALWGNVINLFFTDISTSDVQRGFLHTAGALISIAAAFSLLVLQFFVPVFVDDDPECDPLGPFSCLPKQTYEDIRIDAALRLHDHIQTSAAQTDAKEAHNRCADVLLCCPGCSL
eukprot:jgi/Bigna1/136209/aug1.32_g10917